MSVLSTHALGVTMGDTLFENLTLTISKSERIGLIAANGRGKSTLLACLAGEIEPTAGKITRRRGLRIGYVQQTLPATHQSPYDLALSALPPEQADFESWRVDVALNDLQMPYDMQHTPLPRLSGGWQRVAMLAAIWVKEPDLLLLDEPTNHLDLHRITFLESWLKAAPREMPVVITSHDRAFLDATTNRTLFLRQRESRVFSLPYRAALHALDEANAAQERQATNDLSKARNLRRQAAKLKNVGVNSGSDLLLSKTKQLTARAKKLEAAASAPEREHSGGKIRLNQSETHAKALITLNNINICTPDNRLLYTTGKKWINRGERVVLLGANGVGKTRLVLMVAQALAGRESPVRCAASVAGAYCDQHLSHLERNRTPLSTITRHFSIPEQRARGVLAGAGIAVTMQERRIEVLSGGQKARLALLLLRLQAPAFYLLDEPTNHLDIEGQEALESELIKRETTCLLVSHDRQFIRNVGTRFWWINGRRLEETDTPEPFFQREAAPPT